MERHSRQREEHMQALRSELGDPRKHVGLQSRVRELCQQRSLVGMMQGGLRGPGLAGRSQLAGLSLLSSSGCVGGLHPVTQMKTVKMQLYYFSAQYLR